MNITLTFSCVILAAVPLTMAAQQPGSATPNTSPPSQTETSAPGVSTSPSVVSPGAQTSSQVAKPASEPSQTSALSGSSAVPATTPPSVDNAHYVIGPEDSLQITVWREPTASGSFPVRPDGMISMVFIGDVPAAGKTPAQLSEEITNRLHKYIQDPNVTVQVMGINSQKIYLIGEVGHVGSIPLSPDMSPLKAIATAGGLSPFANSKHIYILRGSGPTQQKIPFNYKQALRGDDRQQIVLHPGDTIVVP
jgi:polysaccharide export outer membrane protein